MSSVDLASDYARKLVGREAGGGSVEDAMRRIGRDTGIGFWSIRSLWYGRAKTVSHDLFVRLRAAYLALCERQLSALQHELAMERARSGEDAFADIAREAEALASQLEAARGRQ